MQYKIWFKHVLHFLNLFIFSGQRLWSGDRQRNVATALDKSSKGGGKHAHGACNQSIWAFLFQGKASILEKVRQCLHQTCTPQDNGALKCGVSWRVRFFFWFTDRKRIAGKTGQNPTSITHCFVQLSGQKCSNCARAVTEQFLQPHTSSCTLWLQSRKTQTVKVAMIHVVPLYLLMSAFFFFFFF